MSESEQKGVVPDFLRFLVALAVGQQRVEKRELAEAEGVEHRFGLAQVDVALSLQVQAVQRLFFEDARRARARLRHRLGVWSAGGTFGAAGVVSARLFGHAFDEGFGRLDALGELEVGPGQLELRVLLDAFFGVFGELRSAGVDRAVDVLDDFLYFVFSLLLVVEGEVVVDVGVEEALELEAAEDEVDVLRVDGVGVDDEAAELFWFIGDYRGWQRRLLVVLLSLRAVACFWVLGSGCLSWT